MKRTSVIFSLLTAMFASDPTTSNQHTSARNQNSSRHGEIRLSDYEEEEQLRIIADARIELGRELSKQ